MGGMLARSGAEVHLLGRAEHMRAVREAGVRVSGIYGEFTARVAGAVTEPPSGEFDYVIVTVKSCDTTAIVRGLLGAGASGEWVSLQNGIGNAEAVAALVGVEHTLAGTIITGFELVSPGGVSITVTAGPAHLGRLSGRVDAAVEALVGLFNGSGLPAEASDRILSHVWGKALYNASLNALGAVLRVPYGELLAPDAWAVIEGVVAEAFEVMRAEGVRVEWKAPEEYLQYLRSHQVPATAAHRSSMLQDIERGRRTEIDYLNGRIASLAEEHGVEAPVNLSLACLVRALERRGLDSRPALPEGNTVAAR